MGPAPTALDRRLARYRAATRGTADPVATRPRAGAIELATRLATAIDGEVVHRDDGLVVRAEPASRQIPIDRTRLATLPGQPPPDVPLVCLDTETTGLATAAGTVAFLIGLGWWDGQDRFRQVQLLLPEHAEERALLGALAAAIPPAAWLVTYNGRGFDWPLLVARYRLAGHAAPAHAGHLDLLPVVRRLFRHRMPDARLRTAEAELLGLHRFGDVDGGEIPERYFGFLRGGPAENLVAVVRHNDQDVRSLARLLAHLESALGDEAERAAAPAGDLGGLARAYARERRLAEALACLDLAAGREELPALRQSESGVSEGLVPGGSWAAAYDRWRTEHPRRGTRHGIAHPWRTEDRKPAAVGWSVEGGRRAVDWSLDEEAAWRRSDSDPGSSPVPGPAQADLVGDAWWSPRRAPDFGGRPRPPAATAPIVPPGSAAFDSPWTAERIRAERAHVLRRLGRYRDAVEAWEALAAGPSRLAIVAAIELAKLHEHRLRDRPAAIAATTLGLAIVDRRRRLGRPEPALEADLRRRLARLHRRGRSRARRSVA